MSYDFSNVDPRKSNRQIAREMGCSPTTVDRYFRLQGIDRGNWRPARSPWYRVDWTQSNEAIAETKGLSVTWVRQARAMYAQGVKPPKKLKYTAEQVFAIIDEEHQRGRTITAIEIADRLGCAVDTARRRIMDLYETDRVEPTGAGGCTRYIPRRRP